MDQIYEACDNYADDDRANFNETGLFDRMPPSVGLATEQKNGRKWEQTGLTHGFCVNETGTDKHEPLIIGHSRHSSLAALVKEVYVA